MAYVPARVPMIARGNHRRGLSNVSAVRRLGLVMLKVSSVEALVYSALKGKCQVVWGEEAISCRQRTTRLSSSASLKH
jgi:hypothetical protein